MLIQSQKKILSENKTAQKDIISEFGSDVISIKGDIDNKKLGRVAFKNEHNQLKLTQSSILMFSKRSIYVLKES